MAQKININKYIAEVKRNLGVTVSDEIIEKDLLLTLILEEFETLGLGKELIFKGGTLLSRNYLKYHRFSEDLDFVHRDSNKLREMNRSSREKKIKEFIDFFVPKLSTIAENLGMTFSTNRSDTKFCTILHGRTVYIFRLYYSEARFIKIEINFVERVIHPQKIVPIKVITDLFDSRELMFSLGLSIQNFRISSYPIEEIIIEKYRAILTREELKERDLFDLFFIPGALNAKSEEIVQKIKDSSLIKRELDKMIEKKLELLERGEFFKSSERIEYLAIAKYDLEEFEKFKIKITPKLIDICKAFLDKSP